MFWILESQGHHDLILAQSEISFNYFCNLLQQKNPENLKEKKKSNVLKIKYFPGAYLFQKPSDKVLMTS